MKFTESKEVLTVIEGLDDGDVFRARFGNEFKYYVVLYDEILVDFKSEESSFIDKFGDKGDFVPALNFVDNTIRLFKFGTAVEKVGYELKFYRSRGL